MQRIVTKIGDIYIVANESNNFYLQLVGIDRVAMSSDVVVIFKGDTSHEPQNLTSMQALFYTHTTVKQGIKDGHWQKIGHCPVAISVNKLTFKLHRSQEFVNAMHKIEERNPATDLRAAFNEPYWDVWNLDSERLHSIDFEEGLELPAEEGSVYNAASVVKRIKGELTLHPNIWPKDTVGAEQDNLLCN